MPERVLITGARAPAALDLARSFKAAGFEVHMADCAPSRMAAFSRAVAKVHRYPSPRADYQGFTRAMLQIIERLGPLLVIPTCEEVFYLATIKSDRVFAPPLPNLRRLHSKYCFAQDLAAAGVSSPQTRRLQNADELHALGDTRDFVFKPEFSRFGVQTLIGPSRDAALALRPTAAPWVVQKRVHGSETSFYAACVKSRLVAFSAYRSPWKFDGGAGYAFETLDHALHDRLLEIAHVLAAKFVHNGQFACDMIVDATGKPWLIECNPRATSGAHLFDRSAALALAMLGREDSAVFARDARMHVGPALWSYGLADALRRGRLDEWRARRRVSADVISAPADRAPLIGALVDTMRLSLSAAAHGKRLTEMATADIEWNGEAL